MKNPEFELSIRDVSGEEPPSRYHIKRWIRTTLKTAIPDNNRTVDISIRFVNVEEGLSFNHRFLQKEHATNVLSFDYSTDDLVMGDIIICCPVVISEAEHYKIPLQLRYAHMIVHGMLHLLSYVHDTPSSQKTMETMEETILTSLKFPSPYIQNS